LASQFYDGSNSVTSKNPYQAITVKHQGKQARFHFMVMALDTLTRRLETISVP